MTVYVDDMAARFGRLVMCHMLADSDAELRDMARRIGVAQRHHQGDHFDICRSKRHLAVALGAVEVSQRTMALMRANRRTTGTLGDPSQAKAVWLRIRAGTQLVFATCSDAA